MSLLLRLIKFLVLGSSNALERVAHPADGSERQKSKGLRANDQIVPFSLS